MRITQIKVAFFAGLVLALVVPVASASSISFGLTSNNLGVQGSVGTVTLTQIGINSVQVSITMNPGYTIKLQGGDIGFNASTSLNSASISSITISAGGNTYSGLSFNNFKTNQNVSQFGTFTFDLANFKGGPNGITSADQLSFVISGTGLTLSQLEGSFVVHFCDGPGTKCAPQTGFASGGPAAAVPEPSSLTLLGTGVLGLLGVARRRYFS